MTHLIINYAEKCEREGGENIKQEKIFLKILPPAGEDILDFLNNNLKNPNMDYLSLLYLCWMGSLGNIVPEDHEDAKLEKALLPEARRKKMERIISFNICMGMESLCQIYSPVNAGGEIVEASCLSSKSNIQLIVVICGDFKTSPGRTF